MAGRGSEYRLSIRIAGELERSLLQCTDLTRREIRRIVGEAERASERTSSIGRGLQNTDAMFQALESTASKTFRVITTAASAAGAAVIGIGTKAAQVGIEFESAFAGVKKTTEATAKEYQEIRKEILAMTRDIPASGSEIAEVAEAAGQLGIAKENLLDFSRVMIDLGESTNLSSGEAASALAKFANITGMDAGNYSRLGSTIVDLGNNFATTEADIVSMATRLAASGELAGFTEAQILAMSTAMSSVGIEAEAGGSAMSKMIKMVQVAVETNSKSLQKYAKVAGKSVNEFREDFEKDGLSAVASFIKGLNDVERNGKSATVILDEMGLTEIRLSNTLLSLANANELMYNAVETANGAWDENTALANEAAQRYETTESKLAIMGNGFKEMGIAMYDQFNEPLREGIDIVTGLVHEVTEEIGNSNVIRDIAQEVVGNIPSVIRIIQETAAAFGSLAEPFLGIGEWLIKNPKVIVSAITGIGSTLAAYKVVRGITNLAGAFISLGTAALPVIGIAGGFAALVGVGTYFAQLDEELTQANLDRHLGDITLSMKELDETARHIVGDGYLGQLDEIMAAEISSDNMMKSMEDAVREINKERWKLSVGISFSEEDKEGYARTAQQYIENLQDYIENEGYTFQLTAELLLSDSVNMGEILADNTAFYTELGMQMQGIGDEVSRVITEALENGLEIDQEEIDRLLEDASRVQEAFADAENKAKLEALEARYSGAELDSDSLMNLMNEVNNYMAEAEESAWGAYEDALAKIDARRILDENFTDEDYEKQKQELLQGTYRKESESTARIYGFLNNTLNDAYEGEIGPAMESVEQYMREELEGVMNSNGIFSTYSSPEDFANQFQRIVLSALGEAGELGYTQDAMGKLLEYMAPVKEKMERLEEQVISQGGTLDVQIQRDFDDAEKNINMMEAIAGNEESMWKMFGTIAGEDEDYALVMSAVQEKAQVLPQAAIDALYEKQPEAETAAREMLDAIAREMGDGVYADVPVFITYSMASEFNKSGTVYGKKLEGAGKETAYYGQNKVGYRADGGIVTEPELSWIAEAGYPESVIPLDGSANAISLWRQTGELLGIRQKSPFRKATESLLGGSGASWGVTNTVNNQEDSGSIVFSPTIQISGSADKKDVEDALETAFEKFESMMDRYNRNRERYSFSGG